MATVCVGCGLNTDLDGKLVVQIEEEGPLRCGDDGLVIQPPHLRRRFDADGASAVTSDVGPAVSRDMDDYTTVEDSGTALGVWTLNGDGTVTVNRAGLYHVTQQTIVRGSTGQVVGGRARVIEGAGTVSLIIASDEFNDKNHVVDLAYTNDGPEFNASNIRHLAAGAVVTYIANAYLDTVGQDVDWNGEFTITYLGKF